MDAIEKAISGINVLALSLLEMLVVGGLVYLAHVYLTRITEKHPARQFRMQLGMAALTLVAIIVVLTIIPVSEELRGQLLSLVGILLSAAIALSASTFVGNAMAGIMIRAVRSFKPGDFIRAGDHFGRVTEQDLLHTEIQTERRDLTTLPNLYLVTNPLTVTRATGTVVGIRLSLGYDVPHKKAEELMRQAATDAGLEDPFVQICDLGDFSVTYRVAGFLTDLKKLLGQRSALRARVLDALHGGGIEIVSPTVMMQRPRPEDDRLLPPLEQQPASDDEPQAAPEERIFDKADEASDIQGLRTQRETLQKEIGELQAAGAPANPSQLEALQKELESVIAAIKASEENIARHE